MDKDNAANAVVNEQINRMIEQERTRVMFSPIPEIVKCHLAREGFDENQVREIALRALILVKISMTAELN